MKRLACLLFLLVILGCFGTAQASVVTNLITNGNFEAMPKGSTLTPGTWGTYDSLPGWKSYTNPREVEVQYALDWAQPGATNINTTHYIELDATNTNVKLGQKVDMEHGASYTLSFDYFNRTQSSSSGMAAFIGKKQIFSTEALSLEWQKITQDFTWNGKTDSKIFSLLGTGQYDTLGAYIDNVSLVKKDPANTPLPAAAWFFGTGVLGLVGLRRNSRA